MDQDSSAPPAYFFSYARKDWDEYMERFFEELEDVIKKDGGLDPEKGETGFIDRDDIRQGSDWNTDLARALQRSRAMLSVYTPWYFKRTYCGKEFQVFLERQTQVSIGEDGAAHNSDRIIPLLWVRERRLAKKLPPVTKYIHFEPARHSEKYKSLGMREIIAKGGVRTGYFRELLSDLADRILDLTENDPLPERADPPSLATTRNAFAPSVESTSPADAPSFDELGPGVVQLVLLHPEDSAGDDSGGAAWQPLGALQDESLFIYLAELAGSVLSLDTAFPLSRGSEEGAGGLVEDLRRATRANAPTILVVDESWLSGSRLEELERITADPSWRGGFLLVGMAADRKGPIQTLADAWGSHRSGEENEMPMATARGTADLDRAFLGLLVDVQGRVTEHGEVVRKGRGGRTDRPPTVRGPGSEA